MRPRQSCVQVCQEALGETHQGILISFEQTSSTSSAFAQHAIILSYPAANWKVKIQRPRKEAHHASEMRTLRISTASRICV